MTPIQRTLLAIAAFLALAVGTFIYFIANWDASKAQSIGRMEGPALISSQIRQGTGGSASGSALIKSTRA